MCTCWRLPSHFWRRRWAGWSPCQHLWWWSLWWPSHWMWILSFFLPHRCRSCWRRSCLMPLVVLSLPRKHSTHTLLRLTGKKQFVKLMHGYLKSLPAIKLTNWLIEMLEALSFRYPSCGPWYMELNRNTVETFYHFCSFFMFEWSVTKYSQSVILRLLTVLVWFGDVWSTELWVHRWAASRACFRAAGHKSHK